MEKSDNKIHKIIELDKNKTGYSLFCITSDGISLGYLFDIFEQYPCGTNLMYIVPGELNKKVCDRLDKSWLFTLGNFGSLGVLEYFISITKKAGHFVALPYNEIPTATEGSITFKHHLEESLKEGYLKKFSSPDLGIELAELTDKIYYESIYGRKKEMEEKELEEEIQDYMKKLN